MTHEELKNIWENDLNCGEQGDRQGLIWQKPNGKWIALFADPNYSGRIYYCQITYDPWTGKLLPDKVEHYAE